MFRRKFLALIIAAVLGILSLPTMAGADRQKLADVPQAFRVPNWEAENGQGSCFHAAIRTCLAYQHRYDLADNWEYAGGEYASRLTERMTAAGIPYAVTTSGDVWFLDWMARNRLAGSIGYFPAHAVVIVDFTPAHAVLLDPNDTDQYLFVPRGEFVYNWQHRYGGVCIVPVIQPALPWPALTE